MSRFSAFIIVMTMAVSAFAKSHLRSPLEPWLASQERASIERMLSNLSPADGAPGSVIASPQRAAPNYYFHWVRDAALTMDIVVGLYDRSTGKERQAMRQRLLDYVRFSRGNQTTWTRTGLGEPKFHVDGSAFMEDWCRPQNDGPALRAITLTHVARRFLANGEATLVKSELYDSKIPTDSVIKSDLEYVSHHWREPTCDIWEEVSGDHLYTRLAQHRALIEGAELARDLGDPAAANFYVSEAQALQMEIDTHWDPMRGILIPTLNRKSTRLLSTKGDIDTQVILGLLHGSGIAITDARARSTLNAQTQAFATLYAINTRAGVPGVAVGRYPEDIYDGDGFKGGNPWVLTTAAFATAHYALAKAALDDGVVAQARRELALGDEFLDRLHYHANKDGSLSEQLDRNTGFMTSARDLTWSHAEFLRAAWAREKILSRLP